MSKKVVLVGHCGPDSSYLKQAIRSADRSAAIHMSDDQQELMAALESGPVDLILFNRELGYGFDEKLGVAMIRHLHKAYPTLRMMLVSNYPEAQADAEKAGALPGFGKREMFSARVSTLLKEALGLSAHS